MTITCWRRNPCEHAAWKPHHRRSCRSHSDLPVTSIHFLSIPTLLVVVPHPHHLTNPIAENPSGVSILDMTHFKECSGAWLGWLVTQKASVLFLGTHTLLPGIQTNFLSDPFRSCLLRDHILPLRVYVPQITDVNSTYAQNLCFSRNTVELFCLHAFALVVFFT